jgi:hypothetical protein
VKFVFMFAVYIFQAASLFMGSQVKLKVVGPTEIGQTYECGGNTIALDQVITLGPNNPPATGDQPGMNE